MAALETVAFAFCGRRRPFQAGPFTPAPVTVPVAWPPRVHPRRHGVSPVQTGWSIPFGAGLQDRFRAGSGFRQRGRNSPALPDVAPWRRQTTRRAARPRLPDRPARTASCEEVRCLDSGGLVGPGPYTLADRPISGRPGDLRHCLSAPGVTRPTLTTRPDLAARPKRAAGRARLTPWPSDAQTDLAVTGVGRLSPS
jgi:hypothetical protein